MSEVIFQMAKYSFVKRWYAPEMNMTWSANFITPSWLWTDPYTLYQLFIIIVAVELVLVNCWIWVWVPNHFSIARKT